MLKVSLFGVGHFKKITKHLRIFPHKKTQSIFPRIVGATMPLEGARDTHNDNA